MRVLLIVEAASAGVGRHVVDLARGLIGSGCTVHLVYSERRIDAAFAAGLASLPSLVRREVTMRRGPQLADLHVLRCVRRYASEHGPFDIVHGHSSKGGALARLMKRHAGAVIYTPHCVYTLNPRLRGLKRAVYGRIERALARRTDRVIAVSRHEADHLETTGIATSVACIPNGIEPRVWPERRAVRSDLGLEPAAIVVGFLGRLSAQKNPALLIDSFATFAHELRGAVLLIGGTGELEQECRELVAARSTEIGDRVRFLGYTTPERILPACDLFALPSVYEAHPYVLLEAMACGVAVVATAASGFVADAGHGETGIAVEGASATDFGAAVAALANDAPRRASMAAAARRTAADHDVRAMVASTLEVYEDALGAAGRVRQARRVG